MSYLSDLLGEAYKEGMTEDEISTALQTASIGTGTDDLKKLRAALDKANSEAAGYKKQLRAKQTEGEAAAAAQAEELERLTQENADLKHAANVSTQKSKFIAMGYDEKLAKSTAEALCNGDMDIVMKNQAAFLKAHDEAVIAERMRDTPRPGAGVGTCGVDYSKMIAEAQEAGQTAAVAYYTRLQAQQESAQK